MNATKAMAKKHGTKAAFLSSLLSLFLCVTMLIGTTLAWFTDTVTSGDNQIVAGNLDIDVEYALPDENGNIGTWTSLQGSESLFSQDALWEPGHTEVVYLRVVNKGTLALNYRVNVTPIEETGGVNQAGGSFKLSDYMCFKTNTPETAATPTKVYTTREAAREIFTADEVTAAVNGISTMLTAVQSTSGDDPDARTGVLYAKNDTANSGKDIASMALVVYMPEEVGNGANYMTGTQAPEIKLGVTVYAWQEDYEKDSFGNDYDIFDSEYDGLKPDNLDIGAVEYDYFPQVSQTAAFKYNSEGKLVDEVGTQGVTLTAYTDGEKTGQTVTLSSDAKVIGTDSAATVTFKVQDDAEKSNVTGSVKLNVYEDDTANGNFSISAQETENSDENRDKTTYEVNVETEGVVVLDNSYVVEMYIGKNLKNVAMYHNTNGLGVITTMNKLESVSEVEESANFDVFFYDSESGFVTMKVDEFSPFTAVYDKAVAMVGSTYYNSLQEAIDNGNGKTVVMLKDISENITVASGTTVTLDLYGHTLNGGTVANSPAITNNGTLTVIDGSGENTGTIQRADTGADAYYVVDNQGTLTFKAGIVTNGSGSTEAHAGASLIRNGEGTTYATLNIEGGTFTQEYFNVIKDGGNSEVNISGGTISCGQKYAVLTYGKLTISGGSVTGPISIVGYKDSDGSVSGKATISGGNINSTVTIRQYTGYHADTKPSLTITGGEFSASTTFAVGEGTSDTALTADTTCGTFTIKGGAYGYDPSVDYSKNIHRDYDVTKASDTIWVVGMKDRFASGSGTAEDPYVIEDAYQLSTGLYYQWQQDYYSSSSETRYYELSADITMTSAYKAGSNPCVTPYFYNSVLDGNGHTITLDNTFFSYDMTNSTIKNLNVKEIEYPITLWLDGSSTFDNVDLSGYMSVSGNCGAYAVYACGGSGKSYTFKDCDTDLTMIGTGNSSDYNAIFVGYAYGSDLNFTFTNCTNTGSLICGRAAMFLGNPCTYELITMNISGCKNTGTIQATYVNGSYVANYYVAAQENSNAWDGGAGISVNGTTYRCTNNPPTYADDSTVTNTGTVKHGPQDTSLALSQNADSTLTVTKAAANDVAYYVVNVGLYARAANGNGSTRYYATEKITATEAESYTTTLKNLGFVDQAYVTTHAEGTSGTLAGYTTFTVEGTTYYVIPAASGHLNGSTNPSEMVSVSAYDASGKLLATANLG